MRNEGTIIATDIRPDRLARVAENCSRLGISIVQPILVGESDLGSRVPRDDAQFDDRTVRRRSGGRAVLQHGRIGQTARGPVANLAL